MFLQVYQDTPGVEHIPVVQIDLSVPLKVPGKHVCENALVSYLIRSNAFSVVRLQLISYKFQYKTLILCISQNIFCQDCWWKSLNTYLNIHFTLEKMLFLYK